MFASLSRCGLLPFSVFVIFYIRKTVITGRSVIQGALKVFYIGTETRKIRGTVPHWLAVCSLSITKGGNI